MPVVRGCKPKVNRLFCLLVNDYSNNYILILMCVLFKGQMVTILLLMSLKKQFPKWTAGILAGKNRSVK